MGSLYYVTHPEVDVDLTLPVSEWRLSALGLERVAALLQRPFAKGLSRVISSPERKALETAGLLAERAGVALEVRPNTHENDRSATGPVPPDEFQALANQFFAQPTRSVRGWERAIDAQTRISQALADLVHTDAAGDVAVVGHGGVGTLWYCHLMGVTIDRRHDQPKQGHYFCVDRVSAQPTCAWRTFEAS